MTARAGEPPDHDGYIDEFGDERQARLTAAARLLEWANGMYDGSGCVYCQFSEGHDADCLVDAAISEAAAAPALDRGALERACIAVVGPWFDESHEAGRFTPMELAQRILREYARLSEEAP